MSKFFRLFSLSVLAYIVNFGCLYGDQITISPISFLDQFPSNSVRRIMQDKDGFLWFGTLDGLCRYDGYRVLVFRSNSDNPGLLTSNEITCLVEDNNNNIWIGTKEGISILNRHTFQISEFENPLIQKQNIQAISCSSDGNIWIGVNNIVYKYNPKDKSIENITKKSISDRGYGINYIYEDKFGDIWILVWNDGLLRYKKDGKMIHYPAIGEKNNPFRMYQDHMGQYWLCTWGDGLYEFYPNNNKESMYKKCPIYKKDRQNTEEAFFGIVQDDISDYLWLMSYSGIYAMTYNKDKSLIQIDISYLFKGSNNIFSEIIKDRKGNLWVAAFDEGIFSINFDKPNIQNLDIKDMTARIGVVPNITLIHKDKNDNLWLSQNRLGLCLYDIKTEKVTSYTNIDELKQLNFLSQISSIEQVGDNEIWIGAAGTPKIAVLESQEDGIKCKRVIDLDNFRSKDNATQIRKIFKDSKSNVWIVTNNSVYIQPYGQKEIILFSSELKNITSITEDLYGFIWMGSENNGAYCIESNFYTNIPDLKIVNYNKSKGQLLSNNITAICSDRDGNIWMGTKDGNIIFRNNEKSTFENYTQQCNMLGEAIQDMVADNRNNIWITTNKRIIEYNKKVGASRDYSPSDGLIVNSFRDESYYFDKSQNEIYFGGNHGICKFPSLDLDINDSKNQKVLISDVKINGQSLLNTTENLNFDAIKQELTLSPDDKNIEIDFSTLDFTYPEKIIYAYKMEGIDDDWIYTHHQFATYNHLRKGVNRFLIKATDENRIWNSNVTVFEIYKKPAFYETWWAYLIYALMITISIYWAFSILKNRMKLRQKLEIAQIEKDKSEELVQTKIRYFTNVSHDLLTPLTIISCMIDDIETMIKTKVQQFDIMRANTNRLKRLLQQVLDFRKMESGNMKLRITHGNISSFIQDICNNNFDPLIDRKKIQLFFESDPIHIYGYFDADKVDKIVYNLFSNALKYTKENGKITVSVQEFKEKEINYVSILISDTGVGIRSEDIENIFTRFYNNKNIDTSQTNGIGLSLTKDLVELHHGTISVESVLHEGSSFKVILPIDKSVFSEIELDYNLSLVIDDNHIRSYDNNENNLADEIKIEDILQPKENINVLIVEDNEDILYTLKNILQKRYNVQTATNGAIALNILKNSDVDIVISDVMMPEIDGLELCREIKKDINTSHTPVLMLTAKNSVEDRIACYDAGADGYISKPFDIKLLQSRVNNFLIGKQKQQEEFKSNAEINISVLNYPSLDEDFLNKAVLVIEKYLGDTEFDTGLLAEQMNMSKSSLYRKLKTMTGLSPIEFIRNIRLKHACQMLKNTNITISEVAYSVGFSDPRYFAVCFKSSFDMTPSDYQKKNMD